MKHEEKPRYLAVGCLPFAQSIAGFALPIFSHPENLSLRLVQEVDEISNTISSFKLLEESESPIMALSNPISVAAGESIVHAFVDDNGLVRAGTISQLQDILRDFTRRNPGRKATNLQILELIGTEEEKKRSRGQMRQLLVEQSGSNAAYSFYEGSTLRSILWDQLVKSAPNKEFAKRILDARSKLSARIENGALVLNLEALSHEDRTAINQSALTTNILSEFDTSPASELEVGIISKSNDHNVKIIQKKATEILALINRCGRQEERISILMDAIIADQSIGLTALLQYSTDRAKLAKWLLEELKGIFFRKKPEQSRTDLLGGYESPIDAEAAIAALVPRLFTQHYPLSRGELLYFLAKHLAKWPRVNQAIQKSLDRTVSVFVDNWRPETEHILARGREEKLTPNR